MKAMSGIKPKLLNIQQVAKFISPIVGFNRILDKVKIISAGEGKCTVELKVSKEDSNHDGTLHDGLSATLVDCISSSAVLSHKSYPNYPIVSVNLSLSYVKDAPIGEEVIIEGAALKVSKSLGYLKCDIKNKRTGELLVIGKHTVYFLQPKNNPQIKNVI